jgi:hypothetical protein
MARIRSIKPEFATSEAIADLTIPCRLHFVLLWTYTDDAGRGIDNPRLIKAACWPLDDDMTAKKIDALQAELAANGRIRRYEVDGKRYFEVRNWSEHQKPQHPKESALPPAPEQPHDASCEPHDASPDSAPVVVVVEVDGEVVGEGVVAAVPAAPDPVRVVFDEWVSVTGRTTRTVLDGKRERAIDRAIKSHGIDTVLDAIHGWQNSPFHRGDNETGTVYDDVTLILRDAQKIEGFARCWREPPTPKATTKRGKFGAGLSVVANQFITPTQPKELASGNA